MKESDFLRQQGEACWSLSQSTFDLAVAGRLRALAADFKAKAIELDEETRNGPRNLNFSSGSSKN
jgi:hypothetical protein